MSDKPEESRRIWLFDHQAGWSRTDDPAPSGPDENADAALHRSKYLLLHEWPHSDAGVWMQLHERETPGGADWLVVVSTPFTWHPIVIRDLPSLLALLGQLLPVLEAGGRLDALNDRHETELGQRRQERAAMRPRMAGKGAG